MSSGTNILITVDVANPSKFMNPIPVNAVTVEREKTSFHLLAEDNSISLLGTYDQIMDWAASIMQQMMSWPIVNGHLDWFTQEDNAAQQEGASSDNASSNGQGS